MEENVSPELSLAPVPEQSQDLMDSCSQGIGEEDREQAETEDVSNETLEEPDKSSRASSEIKKTWGFRQSTVAKREMPVEAATNNSDSRCAVRRSGRQSKRTDKLEEFLLTAKRGSRKSTPPSLESGDPPSQTPTDVETASEASFDGNADSKAADDKVESPERRTRSSTKKQTLRQTQSGRVTRGSGGTTANEEGSSDNEEDSRDAIQKDQVLDSTEEEKNDSCPAHVGSTDTAEPPPEQDSEKKELPEEIDKLEETNDEAETDEESDEDSEEDEATSMVVKRGPIRTYVNKKKATNTTPVKAPTNKCTTPIKIETIPKAPPAAGNTRNPQTQEDNDDEEDDENESSTSSSSSSIDSDEGGYDPNALYCICRQKHNKRFMICCDRCEEWFHGDCVGITEARGRLMERNGEDYICPNCTAKKNQVVRPATTGLSTNAEAGRLKADAASAGILFATGDRAYTSTADNGQAVGTLLSSISTGPEERTSEDMGIKGRIEKATNPTGKKKIKIFQPALQQTAGPKADQKATSMVQKKAAPTAQQKAAPVTEPKVASNVEVKTSTVAELSEEKTGQKAVEVSEEKTEQKAEESSSPKCIGPGCENSAQPDSVYCGNDCILKHAAAAMKSITDVKEPNQKAQKTNSTPKRSSSGGKMTQKTTRDDSDSDSDEDYSPDPDEDDEDEHAEEHPPPPATASWSSDHNYIAVTPEKTTPISPTVLNKKSPPEEELLSEKAQKEQEPADTPDKAAPASATPVKANNKKSPTTKAAKVSPKGKKQTPKASSSKTSKKPATSPSKTTAKSKKPVPPPTHAPSAHPPGPIHVTGALRVVKSNFTIPKKQPQQKDNTSRSHSSSSSRVTSPKVSSPSSSHSSSSSRHSHPPSSAAPVSSMPPPSNNQMRQNIRRSLTDILYKRVSDSDDLKMTESEVARLAVAIEKEMFNLCLSTDSKYKNKYRSLMFNLKDPKNKGLFYRVVGGEVSPFRLVRLSAEELLSKEISEWRKHDAPGAQSPSTRVHLGKSRLGSRHDSSSHSLDLEEAPPTSDADDLDESVPAPSSASEGASGNNVLDIFSNMLKDTTSEHRTHLFDLNCKICTGQKMEDEPASKKAKLSRPSKQELHSSRSGDASSLGQPQDSTAFQHQDPLVYHPGTPSYQSNMEVPESQPQLYQEDLSMLVPPAQVPTPVVPTISSVSITRRDPRMARHISGVTVTYTAPEKPITNLPEPLPALVIAPVEVVPKAPLPMPPASPSSVAVSKPSKTSSHEPPPEGETALFLHGQEKIWKGFINMQTVAKFVTKAYLVSGSFEHLKEDLPDTIHIGGRISPHTVWDYVGKLKTSLSKELCLIRFHPATEEEEAAYVSLFSYFSSRKRFGVVANNNRRIKDLYLIPLGSKDPLPSKLLPFDGPGLEPARPNLLLGLLICQKDRKRAGAPLEAEEKRSKTQTKDDDTGLLKSSPSVRVERSTRQSQEISFSTTPPGTPPSSSSEASSSAVTAATVLSLLSSVKGPPTSSTTGKESPSSSSTAASSSAAATPLETILSLFKKQKHDSDASNSPIDKGEEHSLPPSTLLDPFVKQFAQISKEKPVEEDEDDRPYDPEEEYDPSRGYSVPQRPVEMVRKPEVPKQPVVIASEVDDVAYDPEDDSIFDELKTLAPSQTKTAAESITDPQKILESLKIIGNKILQKEGDQQISSTGTPGASDTLLTPINTSLLANSQLLQLGKKVEALVKSSSVPPLINQRRDPRQIRDPRQALAGRKLTDESEESEETSAMLADSTPPSEPQLPDVPDVPDTSQVEETILLQEKVKAETLPFMDSDMSEVSIPLLGEEVEPDMEVNYMDEKVKVEEPEPVKSETEMDRYSIWPNAASILKTGEDSEYEENSQDTPATSYYDDAENTSSIPSTIPVLTQSIPMVETQNHHISHHMSAPGFDSKYRPPADIPPLSTFHPPHQMQGQNLIMRPPPMSLPPPMQGLPPMSGPPPMQGPLPPIHVPPPVRAPPPMQGDSQQFGPPPAAYTPYQNQWPRTQPQQQPLPGPPPQNILPPRGPPPPFPPVAQRGPPPPQMFDPSIPPQHIGQQGPPPGLRPPPTFDGQNNLAPPRFTSPPPPFNFPGNRGPPPHFTSPPPGHFDNRLPPPSHFPGPRGAPPSQYSDLRAQSQTIDQPRGPAEQYNTDPPNSFNLNVEQNLNTQHIYKDHQGPLPGPAYRGPPPNQYEDRRGPPLGGEVSRQHFSQHNQYVSSGPHSPNRGSFDDHRGPLPQENRPHPSQPFGGSERYRLDRHSDEARPIRHGGPLLPTPPEAPIVPPSRSGAHSPDLHRDNHWRRHSPEIRRRSSTTQEDPEPRSGDRFSRFEAGHREPVPGPLQPPEERLRELSEDHRREREREVPHAGRPSWDRGQGKRWSREREWDRSRERERDPERGQERERDQERGRERERNQERSREREQDLERSRDRDQERSRETERNQELSRERERNQEQGRERERDQERNRESERSRGREGDRHKEIEGERQRDQDTDKRKDRDKDRERDRPRERDSDRRDSDRDRVRIRDRDRERDREKRRERSRSREREKEREKELEKEREKEREKEQERERDRGRNRDRERDRDRDRVKDHGKDRGKDRDRNRERERDRDKDRDRRDKSKSREKREEKKDSKHNVTKDREKTAENDKKAS